MGQPFTQGHMHDSCDAAKYVSAVDPATSTPTVVTTITATAAETDGKYITINTHFKDPNMLYFEKKHFEIG